MPAPFNIRTEDIEIDDDAKLRVALFPMQDKEYNTYYIGKLQFGATWELNVGASFMAFTSDEGAEELQITMIDWNRRSARIQEARTNVVSPDGKIKVPLHSFRDKNEKIVYVGEIAGPICIQLHKGVFFGLFISKPGMEELQISSLNTKRKRKFEDELDRR